MEQEITNNGQNSAPELGLHSVSHSCSLRLYGDVEMKCTKCGYVTWRDDSKTTNELIEQMIKEGYPMPDCSNCG